MTPYQKTTIDELLPCKYPVLVSVQLVEGLLHVVSELPGTHLHAGEGGGVHPGHGYDNHDDASQDGVHDPHDDVHDHHDDAGHDDVLTCNVHTDGVSPPWQVVHGTG